MAKKQSQTKQRKAALEKEKQQKQRRFTVIGGAFFLLVIAFAVFSLLNGQNESTTSADGQRVAAEVGAVAPDFELVSNKGETLALSDYRGQPVALMFMHTWWPACNASAPALRAAYNKHQEHGFVVLSVSIQESNTAVDDFIAQYGLEYPFLLDTDGNVSQHYNIYTTPTTYFINPEGVITDILPGIISEQWVDANMASLEG